MGAVYLAQHPMIDRRVAVKVLKRELAEDQALVQRFFNEARAANAIRHPNIVEVVDVGMLPEGLPYLIMELLDGETLASRLSRLGRLPAGQAVAIACQAAAAIEAAHSKGIVHRDLKPDNLFLARDEHAGVRLKVLDFGIAKLRRELTGASLRTGTGALLGTPPYMSPEQCKGGSGEIDHRTDVYALGIILYEMLTGVLPFVADGFGEMLLKHMTEAPRPLREIEGSLPVEVEAAVLKALAKRREDRFPSMAELIAVLASHADPSIEAQDGEGPAQPGYSTASPSGATRVLPSEGERAWRPLKIEVRGSTTFSSATGSREATATIARPRWQRTLALAAGAITAAGALVWAVGGHGPGPKSNGAVVAPGRAEVTDVPKPATVLPPTSEEAPESQTGARPAESTEPSLAPRAVPEQAPRAAATAESRGKRQAPAAQKHTAGTRPDDAAHAAVPPQASPKPARSAPTAPAALPPPAAPPPGRMKKW